MNRELRTAGMSLVEVLIAVAILGVVVAVLSTTTMTTVRTNSNSGGRTQATQVLNYLGRLVAGADEVLFANEELTWDYGTLPDHFVELQQEVGRADPRLYRAEVADIGETGLGTAVLQEYEVTVCWLTGGAESCVTGRTAGPAPVEDDEVMAPLPGIG